MKTVVYLIYLTETGHYILLIVCLGNRLTFSESDLGETTVSFVAVVVGDTSITSVVVPVCGGIGV